MTIRQWSTTASGNANASSINWQEGQAPSTVNNSARELMAQIRQEYDPERWGWVAFSATVSVASQTTFKITGNQTDDYVANRKVKLTGGTATVYADILSASYTSETTVTIQNASGSLSNSMSIAWLSAVYGNNLPGNTLQNGKNASLSIVTVAGTLTTNGNIKIDGAGDVNFDADAGASGNSGNILFRTGGSLRWIVQKNSTAESGSNAGSNFQIVRYSDAGSSLDVPFAISRSTGNVTIASALSLTGGGTVTSATLSVASGMLTVNGVAVTGGGAITGGIIAWGAVDEGSTLVASTNVASATLSAAGAYRIQFSATLTNSAYSIVLTRLDSGSNGSLSISGTYVAANAIFYTAKTASGFKVKQTGISFTSSPSNRITVGTASFSFGFSFVVLK